MDFKPKRRIWLTLTPLELLFGLFLIAFIPWSPYVKPTNVVITEGPSRLTDPMRPRVTLTLQSNPSTAQRCLSKNEMDGAVTLTEQLVHGVFNSIKHHLIKNKRSQSRLTKF